MLDTVGDDDHHVRRETAMYDCETATYDHVRLRKTDQGERPS
ncbi:hypothetical protein [Streptomyces sp. NPDC048436]